MAKQLPYSDHGGDLPPLPRGGARAEGRAGACQRLHARRRRGAVAQATDAGVNKATRALFQVADTPQKMLDLGEEG
jgi:hypothetical protein